MGEVAQIEFEPAVVLELQHLVQRRAVGRLAIGRQSHDLVFVAVMLEAKILGQGFVEDSQRMREMHAPVDGDGSAVAHAPGGAGKIAEAIDRHHRSALEWRYQEGRSEMRLVVLDVVDAPLERGLREGLVEKLRNVAPLAAVVQPLAQQPNAGSPPQHVAQLARKIGVGIAIERDVIDVGQGQPGFREAISDRLLREPGPMLGPPEALLFGRRYQAAVDHDAGGGIGMEGVEPENRGHGLPPMPSRSSRSRVSDSTSSEVARCSA